MPHGLGKPTSLLNQAVAESQFDLNGLRQILYDRQRLMTNLRPLLLSTLRVALDDDDRPAPDDEDGGSEAAETEAEAKGLRPVNEQLVLEIQSFHLQLEVQRKGPDVIAVKQLASELLTLLNQVVVVAGNREDLQAAVGVIGNCAVEMEMAYLAREAEDTHKRGIGLDDTNAGIHIQYCDFLLDQGRTEPAQAELSRAKELDPTDRRVLQLEAKMQRVLGVEDPDLGKRLKEAFLHDPANSAKAVAYLLYLDGTDANLDEFRTACSAWEEALPVEKKVTARRALADRLATLKDEQALGMYDEVLQTEMSDEDRADIYHNMATLTRSLKDDTVLAEQHWLRAYELDPSDLAIRASFSQFLSTQGKMDDAIKVAKGEAIDRRE